MRVVAASFLVLLGCGAAPASDAPQARHAHLGADTAALVGGAAVPTTLVAEVARAEHLEPRAALDRLVVDALAAEGARAAGEEQDPAVARQIQSVLTRATVERAKAAAVAGGLPNDDEVATFSRRYWRDVDLPEQARVIHAVVLRPKDASRAEAAHALATRLATTLSGATSEDDFESRAKALPHEGIDVRVERLAPFVEDGRIAEGEEGFYDASFAHAAFALKKPGDTSAVVDSPFGWHVIRLLELRPPKIVPIPERRQRFASEVYSKRGSDALAAIIAARAGRVHVELQPDADALMALLDQRSKEP
jgi:hypothetical protein